MEFLNSSVKFFGYPLGMLDIIGSFFGLVCVWLTVKQNNWCWPTGIMNCIFFMALFFRGRLYCDAGLQVLYLALNIYGWCCWLRGGEHHSTLHVSRTSPRLAAVFAAVYVAGTILLAETMIRFTNSNTPWWDASMTMMCIVAQWMLSWKKLENWWVWIASNISQFFLYQYKHMYVVSWLQIIFIILSIRGFWLWWRELQGVRAQGTGDRHQKDPEPNRSCQDPDITAA
jgi:nicotinamide mononucleotide transporter